MARKRPSAPSGSIESHLAAVLECAPLILWACDLDGVITLSTGSGLAAFGLAPGQAVGRSLHDVHADRPDLIADFKSALAGERIRAETTIGGRVLSGEMLPLRDDSGVTVGVMGVTIDITDRVTAERERSENAARYRALVEELPDLLWTANSRGEADFLSEAAFRIAGYSPDEYAGTGRSALELAHPDDQRGMEEAMRALIEDGVPFDKELRIHCKDGSWKWLRNRSIARYERDGAMWVDGLATDITPAKRAGEALQRNQERLRALIESIPDLVWTVSQTGELVFVSDPTKVVGDFKAEDLTRPGNCLTEFIALEDVELALGAWRDLIEQEIPLDIELRLPLADGGCRYTHNRARRPYRREGVLYVDGITTDITDRKLAEHALRESEERFRQLAEHTDKVYSVATVGLTEILYVNPAYELVFGQSCDELFRNPHAFLEALHPEDRELALERMAQQLQGEFLGGDELRIVRPDGQVRWIASQAYPIRDAKGEPYRVAIFAEDITNEKLELDRKERDREALERSVEERTRQIRILERERSASEKLAATGRMAARIAHEINNPLAGIKNAFLLIKDAVPEDHPHHHFVGRIEHEINRIATILRQMFDLYPQEAIGPSDFDMVATVSDVVSLVRTEARERGVSIDLVHSHDGPCPVHLVEGAVRQVLYNLVHNAVDASPVGGTVGIGLNCAEDSVELSVADEGSGIPEKIRDRLFEPFFTTKPGLGRPGLGLGLSVSKHLVERMGGQISFETRPSEGTRFCVRIPRRTAGTAIGSDGPGPDTG